MRLLPHSAVTIPFCNERSISIDFFVWKNRGFDFDLNCSRQTALTGHA